MSGLTDLDAHTLWSALVDVRDAHSRVPSDADSWDLVAAIQPHVEAIVARAVNEALAEAANEIESVDEGVWAMAGMNAATIAARIVRARTT